MILQDLLKLADCRKIAAIWKKRFYESDDIKNLSETIQKFQNKLCTLEANPSEDIMMANRVWEDGVFYIEANLFVRKEFLSAIRKIKEKYLTEYAWIPGIKFDQTDSEYYVDILHKLGDLLPESYGYEFSKWEDILGAEIVVPSVKQYGTNEFLADVLFEMSFNGMEREQQEERREILDQFIEEIEKLKELPEEERYKNLKTLNLDELRKELDLPEPDPEEMKRSMLDMYIDSVKTNVAKIADIWHLSEKSFEKLF